MASPIANLRSPGVATLFILIVSIAYILFVVPGPGIALPWMLVDDGLFFRWSVHIQNGDWLGPWDYLTTSKGPLHPLLVAWVAGVGISPFAYRRLLLLVGSLVFVYGVIRPGRPWLRLLLLMALLADPFQFGAMGLRNLREGTYLPIQMIGLALGSHVLDRLRSGLFRTAPILLSSLGMAFALGLLLITREGRIIVVLQLMVWLLLAAILVSKMYYAKHLSFRRLLPILLAATLTLLVPLLPLSILRSVHAHHYAYPLSNSLEEGGLGKFVGKLSGLREKGDKNYIPRVAVKKQALLLAIKELPDHPAGLRSILKGISWSDAEFGCRDFPDTCQDMATGWLMWSLRRSVAAQVSSPPNEAKFQAILANATKELEQLCTSSSRLECVYGTSSYLANPVRWGFVHLPSVILRESFSILSKILIPDPFPLDRPDLSRNTLHSPLHPSDLARLGVQAPIPTKEQIYWQRLYVLLSLLGVLLRWVLLGLLLVFFTIKSPFWSGKFYFDPVAAWLTSCVLIQSTIYLLISLTSFSGVPYTLLTAPIAVGLYARLVEDWRPSLPN